MTIPSPKRDATIGVIKNYGWPDLQTYAHSLDDSGFTGQRLMFYNNVTDEALSNLSSLGFDLVEFVPLPELKQQEQHSYLAFGRYRFWCAFEFFLRRHHDYRYLIWTDIRDLVFQSNPSTWLESHLHPPYSIVAAPEGWLVKDEEYNDLWTRQTFPIDYPWLREHEVLCSGTIAGEASAMTDLFRRMTALSGMTLPTAADQCLYNYIIRTDLKDITLIPSDNWCATGFPSKNRRPNLLPSSPIPRYRSDAIVELSGQPYAIHHQYDRDPDWKAAIEARYA